MAHGLPDTLSKRSVRMVDPPWICAPCQAGDCRDCDMVDGWRARLILPIRECACPRCADDRAHPSDAQHDYANAG